MVKQCKALLLRRSGFIHGCDIREIDKARYEIMRPSFGFLLSIIIFWNEASAGYLQLARIVARESRTMRTLCGVGEFNIEVVEMSNLGWRES